MKYLLYASSLILLTVAESTGLNKYGAVGEIIVLPCKNNGSSKEQRWRRDSTFLSFGIYINTKVLDNVRFKIVGDINIEYNLQISNARLEDFGAYWCEIQIKEHVSRTKVMLQRIERYPDDFTEQFTRKGKVGFTVESTEYSTYDSSSFQFLTHDSSSTEYGTSDIEGKDKGSNGNQYFIYGSFAAGLVLVLCLSIGLNTFYRRRVQSAQSGRPSVIENTIEEYVNENANTTESNNENAYFSNYELIDEHNMIELNNPNFQISRSNRTARQTSLSFSDRLYFEVVDDKDNSMPSPVNNEQQSDISFSLPEESFNSNSYESTEKHSTFNKTNDNLLKSTRQVSIERSTSSKSVDSTSSEESKVVTLNNSEYLNPYTFLKTNGEDFGHSYGTLITTPPVKGFENSVKLLLQQKRHSFP